MKQRIITFITILLISHSGATSLHAGNHKEAFGKTERNTPSVSSLQELESSNAIPFKILKRPYAWDIRSVTYLGRKSGGYNILIKGMGIHDRDGSEGLSGMQVQIGFYQKDGKQQMTGTYHFPPVKKGEAFSKEFIVNLPHGLTPATIGGFLFSNAFDYEEELNGTAQSIKVFINAPEVAPTGSQIRLTYTLEGCDKRDIKLPDAINGFDILVGPIVSKQHSTTIMNGEKTTKESAIFSYVLMAKEVGVFTLPPATIHANGHTYKSDTKEIKVIPPDEYNSSQTPVKASPTAPPTISADDIFLRSIFTKTNINGQDAIEFRLRLYTTLDVKSGTHMDHPKFDGFIFKEMEVSNKYQTESYKGRNYLAVDIKKFLLYPQRTDNMSVSGATMEFVVTKTMKRSRESIFDSFFSEQIEAQPEVKKILNTSPVIIDLSSPSKEDQSVGSGTMNSFDFNTSVLPSFPGGNEALNEFISQNLKYPVMDQDNGVQGRVVVEFVVDSEGQIEDIKILKGLSSTIDVEAVRLVRAMPKWIPGLRNEEPARFKQTIPLNFRLN